jgi:plasmid maintenance system antidote protein VapI
MPIQQRVRHVVTARVERLVCALRAISQEIAPHIHLVSQAARDEWTAVQAAWPSDEDLRKGTTALTEGELEDVAIKVRRFRGIVQGMGAAMALIQSAPRRMSTAARSMAASPVTRAQVRAVPYSSSSARR